MTHDTTDQRRKSDRGSGGLLAGTVVSAFLALVFGICLTTILDATHSYPRGAAPMKIATIR